MFGYIKPDKENLLVKDLALYKATYCGLCSVIKKDISFLLPFSLSYDFVFLDMVRSALAKEKSTVTKGYCKYNPLKKCAYSICKSQTRYTAESALILMTLKSEDDISDKDTRAFRKLPLKLLHWYLSGRMKELIKNKPELTTLVKAIMLKLGELRVLEKDNSAELDKVCGIFGDIMAEIVAFGFCGNTELVAREIGSCVGRYIYMIDAVDDHIKDAKSGAYNPLIAKYGSTDSINEKLHEIDVAVSMFSKRAALATELLEECEYTRIINNVVSKGMGAEAYKIMTRNGEKND